MKLLSVMLLLVLMLSSTLGFNQSSSETANQLKTSIYLEELFGSGLTFHEIKAKANLHFQEKYPSYSPYELSIGTCRDGDYVKYQRWLSFWQNYLNEDGTLGDITKLAKSSSVLTKSGDDRASDCSDADIEVEWTNLNYNGNMGLQIDQGRTSSMAFHPSNPNIFYVGAAWGGLWKTENGGESYINLNDNLPLAAVSSIIISPSNPNKIAVALSDIVWYGPSGIGVFVSEDGGLTFSPTDIEFGLNENKRIYYMDQNPDNGDEIIVAGSTGLIKTADFFETIDLVEPGISFHAVKYSNTDPSIVYAGGRSGQFYKSTDGGDSFDFVADFGDNEVRIAVPLFEGSTRLAITHGNTIRTSVDNGVTLEVKAMPESNMVVEFAPSSESILTVGNFEVYRSNNFGTSFSAVSHWLGDDGLPFIHVDQRNVFVNPLNENYVYFCNDGGIFRYAVAEDEFANLCKDLINTQYYDIAVSQSNEFIVAGGSQDNGNIFRNADGNWEDYAQTGDGMGQDIDPVNENLRYWEYQLGGLIRWEDGENTGIAPPGEDGEGAWETPFKLDPNNNDRILVGYNSVYASDDHGDTWEIVGDEVSPFYDLEQIAIAPSNSEKIYATEYNNLFVKSPGVDAWVEKSTPVSQRISDLEVDPEDENIIYICYGGFAVNGKVYKSTNGGDTWENISLNLPNLPIMSLETYTEDAGGVFVGTYGAVYYKNGSMTEWKKYGCLPNTSVNDIEIQYSYNKIFIGTHGRGMFEAPISFDFAGIDNELSSIQPKITLFPNPSNSQVTIASSELDLSDCTVKITDATGREIALNTQAIQNDQAGIKLNIEKLIQGNYFITLINSTGESFVVKLTKI